MCELLFDAMVLYLMDSHLSPLNTVILTFVSSMLTVLNSSIVIGLSHVELYVQFFFAYLN